MSVHLYVSPAAAGKTTFVLNRVRAAATSLQAIPRVIVPTHVQVRAWRHQMAGSGGVIGARVMTFDQLYTELLNDAGETYTKLSDPVQYRLLRAILAPLPLDHYKSIQDRPGFILALRDLISELKAAGIWPQDLEKAVEQMGNEPRLKELAAIYAAYQNRLQAQGWADLAGIAWLTVESLDRVPNLAADWSLLVIDGFDNFTEMQIAALKILSGRVAETIITLTGATDGVSRPLVHRRFNRTRTRLQETLQVTGEPLPSTHSKHSPVLAHLEANLYVGSASALDAGTSVEMIEALDRQAEVREALRWLKQRLVLDRLHPDEVALLARNLTPYRPFILQIATEFDLPIRLVQGLPLQTNPAIVALLDLLRLMLPTTQDNSAALPVRGVVQSWRSPYFDWSALPDPGAKEPIQIREGDAEQLDSAARWASVIGGQEQWEEALGALAHRSPDDSNEERKLSAIVPSGDRAQALLDTFRRFVTRLTPPASATTYREFVAWLEELIGSDIGAREEAHDYWHADSQSAEPTSLRVVACIRRAAPDIADNDISALRALKDVLRGLVWAEEVVKEDKPLNFATFFADLVGAVDAAVYHPALRSDREEILATNVIQARGVAFRAVAILGLSEGEFPATLGEDPFLRDADRISLRNRFQFAIDLSTESAESEFFYETITRPRDQLLLTRPRLADNGAIWQASPFWEEVRRLVRTTPLTLTSDSLPSTNLVASWPEMIKSLSGESTPSPVYDWVRENCAQRLTALTAATEVLSLRSKGSGPFDGDLSSHSQEFGQRYGAKHIWSASRFEDYRTCPHFFFIKDVLYLEPRVEPTEGLDARQLGNIYHRILKSLYDSSDIKDKTDLAQLLGALETIANPILDSAPKSEGFRVTAWWEQTRRELIENLRQSVTALSEISSGWVPCAFEVEFDGRKTLKLSDGTDQFQMRGWIDRVDRDSEGNLRIIDYKTGGPSSFTSTAVREGKKLQVLFYALAAQNALKMGTPTEAFYWHVQQAEPSPFMLSKFKGGSKAAFQIAIEKAWEAVHGIRSGMFPPMPPDGGCPDYCPGSPFCWHYNPRV